MHDKITELLEKGLMYIVLFKGKREMTFVNSHPFDTKDQELQNYVYDNALLRHYQKAIESASYLYPRYCLISRHEDNEGNKAFKFKYKNKGISRFR